MEQDLIAQLEEKVLSLLDTVSGLRRENAALKARLAETTKELEEARERINGLEANKEAALERIRAILERIDAGSGVEPADEQGGDTIEVSFQGQDSKGPVERGDNTLF